MFVFFCCVLFGRARVMLGVCDSLAQSISLSRKHRFV